MENDKLKRNLSLVSGFLLSIIGLYTAFNGFIDEFSLSRFTLLVLIFGFALLLFTYFQNYSLNDFAEYWRRNKKVLILLLSVGLLVVVLIIVVRNTYETCIDKSGFAVQVSKFTQSPTDLFSERIVLELEDGLRDYDSVSVHQMEYVPMFSDESYSMRVDSMLACYEAGIHVNGSFDKELLLFNCKINLVNVNVRVPDILYSDTILYLRNPKEIDFNLDSNALAIYSYTKAVTDLYFGNYESSIEGIESLLAKKRYEYLGKFRSHLHFLLGSSYALESRFVESIRNYEEAAKLNPRLNEEVIENSFLAKVIFLDRVIRRDSISQIAEYIENHASDVIRIIELDTVSSKLNLELNCLLESLVRVPERLDENSEYISNMFKSSGFDNLSSLATDIIDVLMLSLNEKDNINDKLKELTKYQDIEFCAQLRFQVDSIYNQLYKERYNDLIKQNILVDRDDNRYRVKKMLDGNYWMIDNLRLKIPGARCMTINNRNCNDYGRFYNYKAAVRACHSLGYGWHLPSKKELNEFIDLYTDNSKLASVAYNIMVEDDIPDIEFQPLGLVVDNRVVNIDTMAAYWLIDNEGSENLAYSFATRSDHKTLRIFSEDHVSLGHNVRCICKAD